MKKGDQIPIFGKILKEFRLRSKMSQEELALESNLDRTYISMLERGIKSPTLTTLSRLAQSLTTTSAQILERVQQMESGGPVPKESKKEKIRPPFYGTSVSCGSPMGLEQNIEEELSLDDVAIKKPEETFFVKASGDSMLPTIWSGDLLIIEKKKSIKNNSIILIQIDNEYSIKRYFKTSKGIKLTPDNPNFKEINISNDRDILICGVVSGILRNLHN